MSDAGREPSDDGRVDPIRVIIVDPDPLPRRMVREVIEAAPDFVVIAEASDGIEGTELACRHRPDVLLIEATLPGLDGIAVTRRIGELAPGVNVVVFAMARDDDLELRALRAGAQGFLSKEDGVDAMPQALRAVAHGEVAISRALTMRLIKRMRRTPGAGTGMRPVKSQLTAREWEVLDLLSAGATTAEVAEALVVAEDTVNSHVKNVMRKLGVRTRREAVEAAEALASLSPI